MSNALPDSAELDIGMQHDGEMHTPLKRVNFEPGMLLGVDATRDEQAYHRRRLNRHRYWLHGAGTVVGLAVGLRADGLGDPESDQAVYLDISPGVGIDGLGREVLCHEPYCLDLRAWLLAQWEGEEAPAILADGLDEDANQLVLQVTMRYASCPSGLQPVMARKVNAGTDPVAASRQQDSVQFDLIAGAAPARPDSPWPWGGHKPPSADDSQHLRPSDTEIEMIDGLSGAERAEAELASHLIYAMRHNSDALNLVNQGPEAVARTLLAEVRIRLNEERRPMIQAQNIRINNLVRPIIHSADQLAWLNAHS